MKDVVVVVGGAALDYHGIRQIGRHDLDIIAEYDTSIKYLKSLSARSIYPISDKKIIGKPVNLSDGAPNRIVECEVAWEGSLAEELVHYVMSDPNTVTIPSTANNDITIAYPSTDVLYTLKMSHRFLKNSPHFLKTMGDIKLLRFSRLVGIPPNLQDWFARREAETYNYGHPSLEATKQEFFKDNFYVYDHDTIHEAVKRREVPAYTRFLRQDAQVACDMDKFFSLPEEYQLDAVIEEAETLAIERSLVPHPEAKTPHEAFEMALQKVCTSITSGLFREFAWEHYHEAMEQYDRDYYARFLRALHGGQIKPFKAKM